AKAARQVKGIRFPPTFSLTLLDPTPTPLPPPPPPHRPSTTARRTSTTTAIASGTSIITTASSGTSTTTTVPSGGSTQTPVPSVVVPSTLLSHRTALSVSIVTNSVSHELKSADSDTRIDSPTSSSEFLTTFDASTSPSAPTESSGGVTVGSAQPKGVPIGVIAGASVAAAAVILLALGLFCIRRRSRRKKSVEGIVTMERINDGSTILHSRSDGDTYHEDPNLSEVSPSSDTPRPWHGQGGHHPQTEVQPAGDNDAHILSPVSIHKSVISSNEVVTPGASSVSRAENIQGVGEQLVQSREDLPVLAGAAFHQVYREVAMLRREMDELRGLGADVPPAYPGNVHSNQ
ncbi:hypothetical protein DXG01_005599, partial [Tephrocybe rancida]